MSVPELVRNYTGLTFSAHGPFGPRPSVNETDWPSCRSSKVQPWTLFEWKNRSFSPPNLMNPKPLSVNFFIVPSAISAFSKVLAWMNANRLILPASRYPQHRESIPPASDHASGRCGLTLSLALWSAGAAGCGLTSCISTKKPRPATFCP